MSKKSRDVKTLHAGFSVFICRFFFFLLFKGERRPDVSIKKNPAAMGVVAGLVDILPIVDYSTNL